MRRPPDGVHQRRNYRALKNSAILFAEPGAPRMETAMPFLHMLPDPGMNYTLNRPLLDGTSSARIKEIGAVAPQIMDYDSWHAVWLGLAKRAEAEERWLDAASYYHGAEFYLPAGEVPTDFTTTSRATGPSGCKMSRSTNASRFPIRAGTCQGFVCRRRGRS